MPEVRCVRAEFGTHAKQFVAGGNAADIASEPRFPRIGLINGRQLVELLIKHWPDIPQEFKDKLGLKGGAGEGVAGPATNVASTVMADRFLYIFLDEAGNLDFSKTGTKYFLLGALTKERPFNAYKELTELKYDLAELGTELEYFHASENAQPVRNRAFDVIKRNLDGVRIDALVVEKRKTGPALQSEEAFYPRMIGYLLKYVLGKHDLALFKEVLIYTDAIPIRRKRETIEKIIKTTLANQLPSSARYRLTHHESKSNLDPQIADYCTWALYRKWNSGDTRSYQHIQPAVTSEFDIFRTGTTLYY